MKRFFVIIAATLFLAACGGSNYAGLSKHDAKNAAIHSLNIALWRTYPDLPTNYKEKNGIELIDILKDHNSFGSDAWLAMFSDKYSDSACVWVWRSHSDSQTVAWQFQDDCN